MPMCGLFGWKFLIDKMEKSRAENITFAAFTGAPTRPPTRHARQKTPALQVRALFHSAFSLS